MQIDPQAAAMLLENQLAPWKQALANPTNAQETVFHNLMNDYAKTEYGRQHGAAEVSSLADYRKSFPIVTYVSLQPLIQRVSTRRNRAIIMGTACRMGDHPRDNQR